MRDLTKYKGVIPAFYACYDENGKISQERVKSLVQYFIDKAVLLKLLWKLPKVN